MTQLARRWAPHFCALLAVSLIPVVLHAYVGIEAEDCEKASGIAPHWAPSDPPSGPERYIEKRMKPSHWREGTLRGEHGSILHYTIARGFDAKHIYYRPEYKLVRHERPVAHEVRWIDADGEKLPVHRPIYEARRGNRPVGFAAYLVLYGGRPVENPYRTQLRAAPLQILTGRVPATLFFVAGHVPESELPAAEERAYEWLRTSWQNYQVICGP